MGGKGTDVMYPLPLSDPGGGGVVCIEVVVEGVGITIY